MQDFEPPSGDIKGAIEKDFGSVEELSKKFNAKAATVQVHSDYHGNPRTLSFQIIQLTHACRALAGAG